MTVIIPPATTSAAATFASSTDTTKNGLAEFKVTKGEPVCDG